MALALVNLDDDKRTRKFMLEELEHDLAHKTLYLSSNLNEIGRRNWESLLRSAIESGNDVSLAENLRLLGYMKVYAAPRKTAKGYTKPPIVSRDAPEMLAEGEFNRFYIRGLCRRAQEDDISEVIIYRAKAVRNPRPESQARIGVKLPVNKLLEDLRKNIGVDPALGVPAGPKSGLSVKLI